ncbi:MAG: sulfurtransferase [Pseudorhodobacter sp. PARRP1]|nr:MAG: sulfurtransferase [Pseudorhodobacter sp. PARRP1]
MTQLTAQQAVAKAATGEITVLDVREASEVQQTGRAQGALHIPLALVALQAAEKMDKATPVAVYCAMGGRAERAAQALRDLGYDAQNIGGIGDWVSAGGALSR